MTSWLPAAFGAIISFGLWGFFTKIASESIDPKSAFIYQAVGFVIMGIIALAMVSFKPATALKGINYGVLSGVASGLGCLLYFFAAEKGKISTVVTMTALYPLVTIILSFILLHEHINLKQFAGIGFALIAIYLMSS